MCQLQLRPSNAYHLDYICQIPSAAQPPAEDLNGKLLDLELSILMSLYGFLYGVSASESGNRSCYDVPGAEEALILEISGTPGCKWLWY